jgi:hypothetical protein
MKSSLFLNLFKAKCEKKKKNHFIINNKNPLLLSLHDKLKKKIYF